MLFLVWTAAAEYNTAEWELFFFILLILFFVKNFIIFLQTNKNYENRQQTHSPMQVPIYF